MKLIETKAHRVRVLKDAVSVIENLDYELCDKLIDNTNARPETIKHFLYDLIEGIQQEQKD